MVRHLLSAKLGSVALAVLEAEERERGFGARVVLPVQRQRVRLRFEVLAVLQAEGPGPA